MKSGKLSCVSCDKADYCKVKNSNYCIYDDVRKEDTGLTLVFNKVEDNKGSYYLSYDGEFKIVRYGDAWFAYKKIHNLSCGGKIYSAFGNSIELENGKSKKYKSFSNAKNAVKKYLTEGNNKV